MKKITKILAILAVFALAFSFAGCKSDDSASSDDDVTISGGSTSGNGSSNGSSSDSNTSGGGNSGTSSDNTSGSSSSGGNGGNTSDDTSGGSSSGGSDTGGSSSGSSEQTPEGFVYVKGATITGKETLTPTSSVFIPGRTFEIADFYMCDHEVTRGEYKALMGSDPSTANAYDKDGNELTGDDNVKNNPVNKVRWYDALVYCNTRSIKENLTPCYSIDGKADPSEWGEVPTSLDDTWDAATCDFTANGYRLPTEAEWEWAARGGENCTYAGSNTIDEVAWYTTNTSNTGTRDVKTKKANAYGLYDMSGNVWEWCWDWYGSISRDTASTGPASRSGRCRRGGSWSSFADGAQVAYRGFNNPSYSFNYFGFRLVRSAK